MEAQRNANYMVHMRVGQCQAVLSRSKETKLRDPRSDSGSLSAPRVLELGSPKNTGTEIEYITRANRTDWQLAEGQQPQSA